MTEDLNFYGKKSLTIVYPSFIFLRTSTCFFADFYKYLPLRNGQIDQKKWIDRCDLM